MVEIKAGPTAAEIGQERIQVPSSFIVNFFFEEAKFTPS